MRPPEIEHSRACLKKAFCKMCVTVCGRFCLNEGGVAGYINRMKVKYAAKWGVQIAGMIFQTRSKEEERRQYIKNTFRCIADCDMCGLCTVFHGKDPELAYADYISGKRDYLEVSKDYR